MIIIYFHSELSHVRACEGSAEFKKIVACETVESKHQNERRRQKKENKNTSRILGTDKWSEANAMWIAAQKSKNVVNAPAERSLTSRTTRLRLVRSDNLQFPNPRNPRNPQRNRKTTPKSIFFLQFLPNLLFLSLSRPNVPFSRVHAKQNDMMWCDAILRTHHCIPPASAPHKCNATDTKMNVNVSARRQNKCSHSMCAQEKLSS